MAFTRSGVASTVRAEAARRGLTQRDLAQRLGVSQASVSARLRGLTPFTVDQAADLADLFDMSLGALVDPSERYPVSVLMDAHAHQHSPAQAVPA